MYAVKLLFESVHSGEPNPSKIDEHYEENHDTLFEKEKYSFSLRRTV